jgi:hypothetical protein
MIKKVVSYHIFYSSYQLKILKLSILLYDPLIVCLTASLLQHISHTPFKELEFSLYFSLITLQIHKAS